MQTETRKLIDIIPYANNPRLNDAAVDAVAESIRQCGYIAPIVVDEDGVILAGHTRHKALSKLGYEEAEVVVKAGLSEEQKRKYRLLDNKTNELAEWDLSALTRELDGLDFGDFDFGFKNLTEGLIDIDPAALDGFFADDPGKKEKKPKTMKCPFCGELIEL